MKLQDILSTIEFHIESESKIDEIAIRNQIEPIWVCIEGVSNRKTWDSTQH